MYVLKTMAAMARTRLKDLRVKTFPEFEIIAYLNEGKNELVKLIRQANENFFQVSTTGTLSSNTPPNFSTITLPSDFAELRNIQITNPDYEFIRFLKMNQSDTRFVSAAIDGGNVSGGLSAFYYDFVGLDQMLVSPAPEMDLTYRLDYIRTVCDMMFPQDIPIGIPPEHYDYIVTWAIIEGLRSLDDPRTQAYMDKLKFQADTIKASVNTRQVKEPEFVKGFGEEEYW